MLQNPVPFTWESLAHVASGAGFVWANLALRRAFFWWPIHPIGYVVGISYPMGRIWFSVFLGWLFKTVVLRYGGSKGYLSAVPVALGAIFGDTCAMVVWLVVDAICGTQFHYLMPG